MNERIRKLRRELDLTQQEFADRLNIKRNTVATYETGKSNPSDAAVNLICRTFNVSEQWLRTGVGEMFEATPETQLDELAKEYDLDDLDRQMMLSYLKLPPSDRAVIKRWMQNALMKAEAEQPMPEPQQRQTRLGEMTREELHAELDRQLDLEAKEAILRPSTPQPSEKTG